MRRLRVAILIAIVLGAVTGLVWRLAWPYLAMRRFDAIEQAVWADIRRTSVFPSRFEFEARFPFLRSDTVPLTDVPKGFRDGLEVPTSGCVVRYSYLGERFHATFDELGRLMMIIPTYE